MKKPEVLAVVVGTFAMLGLSLSPGPALAVPVLDIFNVTTPTLGTISYAGSPAPLIGSGIKLEKVVGQDTSLNNLAVRNCLGCSLDFTTGGATGVWTWGGVGSIAVTGHVDLNGDTVVNTGEPNGTLLTGTFGTTTVTPVSTSILKVAFSEFLDTKNDELRDFYGLPPGLYFGSFNLFFDPSGSPSSGASFPGAVVYSAHVTNSPVPEPSSLLLLGSGLLSLSFWARKKFKGMK
jgi:hypothetical protein